MKYQNFYDDITPITLKDDLAQFLGVNEDGIVEISYIDIVKTAGHSCATVGGAYIIASEGLRALYGNETPKRGGIKVEIQKAPTENNFGVVGSVLSNITGATTDYGFGGLPSGKFNRRGLLFYSAPIDTDVRLTRLDTNKSIGINYLPGKAVNAKEILMGAIGPDATPESKKAFPQRFQDMVKTLFENKNKVIEIIE